MTFNMTFHELNQTLAVDFGEINNMSDGGFERGYEAGYKAGMENVPDLLEKVVTNTLNEYSNEKLESIKPYTFRECTNLTSINLPNVRTLGLQCFHTCTSLTEVHMPKLTTMNAYAFTDCVNLKLVDFPILGYLQASSLQNCQSLESADFPNVNTMGNLVFSGCTNLTKLVLRNNAVCSLSNVAAFSNTPIANGTGYVYVPDDLVDSYKVARNWSTYASQIKPISELNE